MSAISIRDCPIKLTRTTFELSAEMSNLTCATLIRALHGTPGVLLAEANLAMDHISVAHDGAVSAASLILIAGRTGTKAKRVVVAGRPDEDRRRDFSAAWILAIVTASYALFFGEAFFGDLH